MGERNEKSDQTKLPIIIINEGKFQEIWDETGRQTINEEFKQVRSEEDKYWSNTIDNELKVNKGLLEKESFQVQGGNLKKWKQKKTTFKRKVKEDNIYWTKREEQKKVKKKEGEKLD